ncbi:MAG: 1-deoxy-D-xylulose-5-phosphate synthase [Acidimicrobiia bacterium]
MAILDRVRSPADLQQLTDEELEELCTEIRFFLVNKISQTGGHLSPNLGVVELTVALHRSFDSPVDRILWDVGHQAYVHKLITGRREGFNNLRRYGGMSGYPSREESPHDFIENSHASTALSYALGHALSHPDYWTVAVVGDGALTGGMAYEALNHIAVSRPSKLVIVVNDNGRSYAPTVGGLAALANLAHYRLDPRYEWMKRTFGRMLRGLPIVGETADEMANRFKEAVKQIVEPSTVFDTLGLKYSGRIDGHDLNALETTFAKAREYGEPVIVHVITDKGKGYPPAVDDEIDKLHGVGSFDVSTGRALKEELKYTDIAGSALLAEARRHPEVVAISAAMVSSTGLQQMAAEMPDRVFDTGIAEQHSVALAAGMAMAGQRPVVAIYSSFLQRAFDQIVTDVALHNLAVAFLIDRAGITGPDGPSHHGVFDLSYLRMVPNLVVGAPADATELAGMIATAVTHDGPIAIRFPKAAASSLPALPSTPIPIGEWELLSAGEDVLILASGRLVETAEKAATEAATQGISVGVVNARWIKPLDDRLVSWAASARAIITLEDNVIAGGFGAAVMEELSKVGMAGKVRILGIPDRFLPAGSVDELLAEIGLDTDGVTRSILALVAGS